MPKETFTGRLISDFNTQNFSAYLQSTSLLPQVQCQNASFGQPIRDLMELSRTRLASSQERADFGVVWIQPEAVFLAFKELQEHRPVPLEEIFAEVDRFAELLIAASAQVDFLFVPSWVFPAYRNDFSFFELRPFTGIADILMRMNLRLAEKVASAENIFLLNTQKWIESAGPHAFDSKFWYMAKIPYGNQVFLEAVKEIKASLLGLTGRSKKMIVLDLDGILWPEIVGEVGWENLRLGGHDPVGEAYVDFQRALKSLTGRGILLGIASKNDAAYALEAIDQHPEMVLRTGDFSGWEINWQDKAQNIIHLAQKLNLGLDSIVFIDDNPAERARVKEALPEVTVPDWPEDPMLFRRTLLGLAHFHVSALTEEDLKRSESYVTERRRSALRETITSYEEWLEALDVKISAEPFSAANKVRMVQLLNKTNQMNLSVRRMPEAEFETWALMPSHPAWAIRVADKFGDYGLTGLMSLEITETGAKVADFLLSCRVFGKKVEEAMLNSVLEYVKKLGFSEISADFIKAPRNQPCYDFFKKIGASWRSEENRFVMDVRKPYPELKSTVLLTLQSSPASR